MNERRSLRLKGYDYAQEGLYFITICCQGQAHLFGKIENQKMILNDAGLMIKKCYGKLEQKYPDKKCREMVIMSNHFHCILENIFIDNNTVAASLRGRLEQCNPERNDVNRHNRNDTNRDYFPNHNYGKTNQKYKVRDAVGWFKTMTTNAYKRGVKQFDWKRFDKRLE